MEKQLHTPNENFGLFNAGYSNYEGTVELARHRWYYYKEGFSPNLVEKAIEQTGLEKKDTIIDPFNGSGTTTLTAALKGYKNVGIEVNPFTSFLASTKLSNANASDLINQSQKLLDACSKGSKSDLVGFSTFSYRKGLKKWLFNRNILNAFEGGWQYASSVKNSEISELLKFSLITAAMENCNAIKDGKCMRYRETWRSYNYNLETFNNELKNKISIISEDLKDNKIIASSRIINDDVRTVLKTSNQIENYKLCVTSPPYLNTFDYTDIYRPELFLGKFVYDNDELYDLRMKTVRSHIQAKWETPKSSDFGVVYQAAINHVLNNQELLMAKNIPLMIQAYFEDMQNILQKLLSKAKIGAQVWMVVSNSAYADYEIPVDLIIGDIGSRIGWDLKEIGVLRKVAKRKTKYSPNIKELRESVIIFENK